MKSHLINLGLSLLTSIICLLMAKNQLGEYAYWFWWFLYLICLICSSISGGRIAMFYTDYKRYLDNQKEES